MAEINSSTQFVFKVAGLSSAVSVASFEAVEGISRLFEARITLTSEDAGISPSDVVGKAGVLSIETADGPQRYLSGIVSRFRCHDEGKKVAAYHVTLVPRLWRLRQRVDARIFQAKTVPDILKAVLSGAGVSSVKLMLQGTYSPREYCVQYRESDFAFVSRLMEEEGIFYWFEHSDSDHVLVLADSDSAPSPISGASTLPFKGTLGAMAFGEGVSRFSYAEEVRIGKVTLTDFNFKKPGLSLLESTAASIDTDLEAYDYPGEYEVPADGTNYAKVRLQEQQARKAVVEGTTGCGRLVPGATFTLSDHPRDAQNVSYLITALRSHGAQAQMGEVAGSDGPSYRNTFDAIPADVVYRPERVTPRPMMRGVQTAIVTGASGDEICTDEFGRVKVHFHWDRLGKTDDTSSCWIRVSQLWAGQSWGAMWLPRVGHEVIVDFLEGDPDRPIITGRVYHGTNPPPYPLPGEKTKSTIKSNSSVGGGGNNEFRFEDKKGAEEIWLHGQKDYNILIEHDKAQTIGHDESKLVKHDETLEVDHDRKRLVKNDETIEVDGDRKKLVQKNENETINGNKTIMVQGSHNESIGGDETLSVSGDRGVTVSGKHNETVNGDQTRDIGGGLSVTIGGDKGENTSGASTEQVTKDKSVDIGADYKLSVSGQGSIKFAKDVKEEFSTKRAIVVGDELSIQVGDAVVTLKKNGDISVAGKNVTITGTGPVEVSGSKIQVKSDGDVNLEASGNVKIKGSSVGVN